MPNALAHYYLQPLSWRQAKGSPEVYDLEAIGGAIGYLRYSGERRAFAQAGDGAWSFEPAGFFRSRIDVRATPGGELVATFHPSFWGVGGRVEVMGGPTFRVKSSRFDSVFTVFQPDGPTLVSYSLASFFGMHSPVTWGDDPSPFERWPWLLPLSWYLAVRHHKEMAAATAVVSTG